MFLILLIILALCGNSFAANSALTGLTADTTPTSDDLIYTVNSPASSPTDRKVTLNNLFNNVSTLNVNSNSLTVNSTKQVGVGTSTPANDVQFQTTGTTVLASGNGYVGIATTSPTKPLDVIGAVRFRSLDCSSNANGGALTTDGQGNLSCTDDDSGSGGGGSSEFTRTGSVVLYPNTPTTTKVILGGTTTTSAKIVLNPLLTLDSPTQLKVSTGTLALSDGSNQTNYAGVSSGVQSGGITGTGPGWQSFISNIDPSTADSSALLYFGYESVFNDDDGSSLKGHFISLDFGNDIPYDYVCAGNCDIGSLNAMGSTNGADVNIFGSDAGSGANGTGGKVVIHGGAKDGTGLTGIVALAVTNAGLPYGKVGIGTTTVAVNNQVQITGATSIATTNGNVGIGLTNPSAKLEVNGSIVVGGSGQSSLTKGLIVNNGQGNATTDDFTAKGTSDAMALHLEASSNRTGFGITTPTAKVDISGLTAEIKLRVSGAPLQGTTPLLQVQQYGSVDVLTAATGGAKVTGGLAVTNLPSCSSIQTSSSGVMSCGTAGGGGSGTVSGTTNTMAKFTASTTVGDSAVTESGSLFKVTYSAVDALTANVGGAKVTGQLAVTGPTLLRTTDSSTPGATNTSWAVIAKHDGAKGGLYARTIQDADGQNSYGVYNLLNSGGGTIGGSASNKRSTWGTQNEIYLSSTGNATAWAEGIGNFNYIVPSGDYSRSYGTDNAIVGSANNKQSFIQHGVITESGTSNTLVGYHVDMTSTAGQTNMMLGNYFIMKPQSTNDTVAGLWVDTTGAATINNPANLMAGIYLPWSIAGTDTSNKKWSIYVPATSNGSAKATFGDKVSIGTTSIDSTNFVQITGQTVMASTSGKVGIGTTAPTSQFTVYQNSAEIMTANTGGAKVTGTLTVTDTGATGGCFVLPDTDGSGYTQCTGNNGTLSCTTNTTGYCP